MLYGTKNIHCNTDTYYVYFIFNIYSTYHISVFRCSVLHNICPEDGNWEEDCHMSYSSPADCQMVYSHPSYSIVPNLRPSLQKQNWIKKTKTYLGPTKLKLQLAPAELRDVALILPPRANFYDTKTDYSPLGGQGRKSWEGPTQSLPLGCSLGGGLSHFLVLF